MCLPYWNSELDIEVGCWSFSRREHGTISMAGLHSELLRDLSFQALSLDCCISAAVNAASPAA